MGHGYGRVWGGSSGSGASWVEPHPDGPRTVQVPDVVGLDLFLARKVVLAEGLVFAVLDPTIVGRVSQPTGLVVTAQRPDPGTWLRTDATDPSVTVWFEQGPGDASVREPLRPVPPRWHNQAGADPANDQ